MCVSGGGGTASPALMTPCTPVSWMQRSTSRKHWMFPLANTGMATALLWGAVRHSAQWQAQPPPPGPGARLVPSPHSLDVLPGRGARQRPLLLLGAPVHCQQLRQTPGSAPHQAHGALPFGFCAPAAHTVPGFQSLPPEDQGALGCTWGQLMGRGGGRGAWYRHPHPVLASFIKHCLKVTVILVHPPPLPGELLVGSSWGQGPPGTGWGTAHGPLT